MQKPSSFKMKQRCTTFISLLCSVLVFSSYILSAFGHTECLACFLFPMCSKKWFIISFCAFSSHLSPKTTFVSFFQWGGRHYCVCFTAWVQLPDKIPLSPSIFKAVLLTKAFCHWKHIELQKQVTWTYLDQSVILDYILKGFQTSPTLSTQMIACAHELSWQYHLHVMGFVWAKSNCIDLPLTLLKKCECKVSKHQGATYQNFGQQCTWLLFVRPET